MFERLIELGEHFYIDSLKMQITVVFTLFFGKYTLYSSQMITVNFWISTLLEKETDWEACGGWCLLHVVFRLIF